MIYRLIELQNVWESSIIIWQNTSQFYICNIYIWKISLFPVNKAKHRHKVSPMDDFNHKNITAYHTTTSQKKYLRSGYSGKAKAILLKSASTFLNVNIYWVIRTHQAFVKFVASGNTQSSRGNVLWGFKKGKITHLYPVHQ